MTASKPMLQGRRVLLAHGDEFQQGYLAEVVRSSGALMIGPFNMWADVIATFNEQPGPDAVILSRALASEEALSILADAEPRPAVLVVGTGPVEGLQLKGSGRFLPMPYAGFQVVQALGELLDADPAQHPALPVSPQWRGH